MGDEFEAWLASQRTSLREIEVFVYRMSRGEPAHAAMDAVTTALLKKFQGGGKISDEPSRFFAYVKTVAKRALWRYRRQADDLPDDESTDVAWAPVFSDPARDLRAREVWDVVRSTLDGATYRDISIYQVVHLIFSESLQQKDVAARLGVPEATITRAKQRGLALLKQSRPELRGEI